MALHEIDPEIADLMAQELHRQESTLELIASENHVSKAVMEAAGSVLTNKYAEGYPGKRYYGGCQFYDQIENIAIEREEDFRMQIRQCATPQRRQRQPRRVYGDDAARRFVHLAQSRQRRTSEPWDEAQHVGNLL